MQVLFQTRDPEAAALREGVEQRVRFALRRNSWRVPRAQVQLSDVNGPRGGVDKRCQIELRIPGAAPVVVSSVAPDWRSALDLALTRAARFMLRLFKRMAPTRRLPQRPVPHEA